MAKVFNFNKIQRKYFNVTLKNGKTYLVQMPTKQTFESLTSMQEVKEENFDVLYEAVADMLSNNKQGYKVTKNDLEDYSVEDLIAFINAYVDFIKELGKAKN